MIEIIWVLTILPTSPVNHRFRSPLTGRISYWLFVCAAWAIAVELLRINLALYLPRDWPNAHEFDCLSAWKGARLFWLGVNPYTPNGLAMIGQYQVGQPPTAIFWYLPMADFSKALVAQTSSVILLVLLVLHFYLCAKQLNWPAPVAVGALVTSLVISTSWIAYHFNVIQWSESIAFLYVLAWLFLRRGQDTRAGICLGVATTIKLFPGLMVVMLLLGRRWRGVLAASFTYAFVAVVITARFGVECWSQFFAQEKPITEAWLGSLQNSSLAGLVTQIRYPSCELVGHPSRTGSMITGIVSVVLVAAAAWASWSNLKRSLDTDRRAIDLPFALFTVLSVFLNPFVWEHYYALLIQPLFVITTSLWLTFRVSLRRWSDTDCSTGSFAITSLVTAVSAAAITFVLRALSRDIWLTWQYIDIWKHTSLPMFHWQFHYYQMLNFAPWIISILLCFVILGNKRRMGITTW